MSIFKLIRAFQKAKGRSPSPNELAKLKKQAEAMQPSNVLPFQYKKGFPKEIEELIKKGEITRGTAPKTTKKKPAVDPKFEAAGKAQDERSESFAAFKKRMEAQNKANAYKSALRQAQEIDKKKLSIKEVETRYRNLAKYPEGRSYLSDEIYDIERGWTLNNLGNRSREDLIKKMRGYIKNEGSSQPDPFKKPIKEVKEGEQIEMDFTDWDPKGMKGGGLAHMLGFSNGGPLSQSQLVQMYMDEGMSYEDAVQAASASQGLPWDILSKAKGGRISKPSDLRVRFVEIIQKLQTAEPQERLQLIQEANELKKLIEQLEHETSPAAEIKTISQGLMKDAPQLAAALMAKPEMASPGYEIYPKGTTQPAGGEKAPIEKVGIEKLAYKPSEDLIMKVSSALPRDAYKIMQGRMGDPRARANKYLGRRRREDGGRVPMMYGGDPGFAFEYGGSWADWRDNHQHMMPLMEYIGTKLPKERTPFRQELSGGGLAGLPAIQVGPVGINPKASGSYSSNQPYGPNLKEKTLSNTIGFDATIDLPGGFKIKGDYGKYRTRDRLYDADGNFLDKRVRDDHDRYNVGIEWSKKFANGGRIGFDNGGFNKGRRNFLKLAAGLASIPVLGKYFKWAKPAAKTLKAVETSNAAGMPAWFPKLVEKVLKEGKDIGGTVERQIVKQTELPGSKTKVTVEHDLNTGDTIVDIGQGKHGWEDGRYGQPTRLTLRKGEWIEPEISKTGKVKKKKGVKTKDEFDVEEAEFTGDAESVKYEDVSIEKYGDHASDFTEVEKYATGKNIDKKIVGKKREADDLAQGRAEMQAEQAAEEMDDFAKGGLAHMLGR